MTRAYFSRLACMAALCLAVFSPAFAADEPRHRPEMFEGDGRAEWQKAAEVIEALDLKEGDAVADIGGGSGYFTRPLARRVGPLGRVYCCDIAPNLLEYLHERAAEEGLDNIITVLSAGDRPMLAPNSVDLIFFCNTNHHLSDRVNYYRKLIPLLNSGGRLAVVDWHKREQEVGPPPDHNVDRSVVLREMREAGWEMVREETFLPYQYFLIFEPAR